MSNISLLVLPSLVKERTNIHSNVEDALLIPEIQAVQDLYILPIVGTALYNKLLTDIGNNALAGLYFNAHGQLPWFRLYVTT